MLNLDANVRKLLKNSLLCLFLYVKFLGGAKTLGFPFPIYKYINGTRARNFTIGVKIIALGYGVVRIAEGFVCNVVGRLRLRLCATS